MTIKTSISGLFQRLKLIVTYSGGTYKYIRVHANSTRQTVFVFSILSYFRLLSGAAVKNFSEEPCDRGAKRGKETPRNMILSRATTLELKRRLVPVFFFSFSFL